MKYPRRIRTYCPHCDEHQEFSITVYRKGKDRALAEGNRRYHRKQQGYGGQVKPKQRQTAKTTRKQVVDARCTSCGYILHKLGIRLRRLTIST
jgi:large subunit ribosomal protein L44e